MIELCCSQVVFAQGLTERPRAAVHDYKKVVRQHAFDELDHTRAMIGVGHQIRPILRPEVLRRSSASRVSPSSCPSVASVPS